MRIVMNTKVWLVGPLLLLAQLQAQGQEPKSKGQPASKTKDYSNSPLVVRMMEFNKKKDGKLTRDEITDTRLLRLFDQADADKDGVVTKEELAVLAAKRDAEFPSGGRRGGGFGGGGFGFFGPPPQPGQVLPFIIDNLELTDSQKQQIAELQKEVDTKLAAILSAEQKKKMEERGPRGPGGPK